MHSWNKYCYYSLIEICDFYISIYTSRVRTCFIFCWEYMWDFCIFYQQPEFVIWPEYSYHNFISEIQF
jgi:hypothetical protein